jgi:hypothetical protein
LHFQGECDPALGAEFVFTAHAKELIIGDVYVRVYNEQPAFPLEVEHCLWQIVLLTLFFLMVMLVHVLFFVAQSCRAITELATDSQTIGLLVKDAATRENVALNSRTCKVEAA